MTIGAGRVVRIDDDDRARAFVIARAARRVDLPSPVKLERERSAARSSSSAARCSSSGYDGVAVSDRIAGIAEQLEEIRIRLAGRRGDDDVVGIAPSSSRHRFARRRDAERIGLVRRARGAGHDLRAAHRADSRCRRRRIGFGEIEQRRRDRLRRAQREPVDRRVPVRAAGEHGREASLRFTSAARAARPADRFLEIAACAGMRRRHRLDRFVERRHRFIAGALRGEHARERVEHEIRIGSCSRDRLPRQPLRFVEAVLLDRAAMRDCSSRRVTSASIASAFRNASSASARLPSRTSALPRFVQSSVESGCASRIAR